MIERLISSTFGPCLRVSNRDVELVAATGFGPRIVRFAFPEGENALGEWPELSTQTALGRWRPRGGHRLWIAPEAMPTSYAPDDDPVEPRLEDDLTLTLSARPDAGGVEKEITIRLPPAGAEAVLTHRIVNRRKTSVEIAPWALTIIRGGGVALLPSERWRSHEESLDAARPFVLWSFTELSDPRWGFGRRSVQLRADPSRPHPQKAGAGNTRGWCACVWSDTVFVKRFDHDPAARYPDFGCNNEIYGAGDFMELESLGPLRTLGPGDSVLHGERWSLHRAAIPMNPAVCAPDEIESAVESAVPGIFEANV